MSKSIVISLLSICASMGFAHAETLVSEDFNDRAYASPLSFYSGTGYDDATLEYVANGFGDAGYALQLKHSSGTSGMGFLQGLEGTTSMMGCISGIT